MDCNPERTPNAESNQSTTAIIITTLIMFLMVGSMGIFALSSQRRNPMTIRMMIRDTSDMMFVLFCLFCYSGDCLFRDIKKRVI